MNRYSGWLLLGIALAIALDGRGGSLITDDLTVSRDTALRGTVDIAPAEPAGDSVALAYGFASNVAPVADASTNGNAGTVSGATWTNGGRVGGGYVFDGSNDSISAADAASLDLRGALTISAWARFDATGSVRALVAKHNDVSDRAFDVYFESGYLYAQLSSSGNGGNRYDVRTTGAVSSATWKHYAFTWDGTPNANAAVYVDGQSQPLVVLATTFSGTNIFNSSQPLRIGARSDGAWYFGGAIDEVRLYNRALTSREINDIYLAGTLAVPGSLSVDVPATFASTTLITRLVPQGDVSMGSYTNGP